MPIVTSLLEAAVTITRTHRVYPQGMARMSGLGIWLHSKMVYFHEGCCPSWR